MECRYILLKSEYESTVTFGIAVAVDCDECVTILDSYIDLSSDQSKVTGLIELRYSVLIPQFEAKSNCEVRFVCL